MWSMIRKNVRYVSPGDPMCVSRYKIVKNLKTMPICNAINEFKEKAGFLGCHPRIYVL